MMKHLLNQLEKHNNLILRFFLFFVFSFSLLTVDATTKFFFVRNTGDSLLSPRDGSDWQHALPDIQTALDSVSGYQTAGDSVRIFVATGSYTGSYSVANVAIIGGLPVQTSGMDTTGAILGGTSCLGNSPVFSIKGENVFLSGLSLNNQDISSSSVAAVVCDSSSVVSLTLQHCNISGTVSGVLYGTSSLGGNISLIDCDIRDNQVQSQYKRSPISLTGPYNLSVTYSNTPDTSYKSNLKPDTTVQLFYNNKSSANGWGEQVPGGAIFMKNGQSLAIKNAWFFANENGSTIAGNNGGAIALDSVESVSIQNSYFSYNQAGVSGGAIYSNSSVVDIFNSSFYMNSVKNVVRSLDSSLLVVIPDDTLIDLPILIDDVVEYSDFQERSGGGAFYAEDGSMITIYNSSFTYNGKNMVGFGGGACVYNSYVNLVNSYFSFNKALYGGGGFFSGGEIKDSTRIDITNSILSGNSQLYSSSYGGGGVFAYGTVIKIKESQLNKNNAYRGGGVLLVNGSMDVYSSTLDSNSVSHSGGALVYAGMFSGDTLSGNIINSTITGNSASYYGGAVGVCGNAFVNLISNTIVSNTSSYPSNAGGCGGVSLLLDGGLSGLGQITGSVSLQNTILSGNTASNNSISNIVYNTNGNNIDNISYMMQNQYVKKFSYSTVGNIIYQETISDTVLCGSVNGDGLINQDAPFDPGTQLFPLGFYLSGTPCRPFKDTLDCRCNGMPLDSLNKITGDIVLQDILLQDQRKSTRGSRCGMTNTYQGAVEGGLALSQIRTFVTLLNGMVGKCVNQELQNPYLMISVVTPSGSGLIPLTDLNNYYFMTVTDENGDIYLDYNRFSLQNITGNPFLLKDIPNGTYTVTMERSSDGTIFGIIESYSSEVKIESIGITQLEWIGIKSTNWNDADNWQDYMTKESVTVLPNLCYDVYIGESYQNTQGDTLSITYYPELQSENLLPNGYTCSDIYFTNGGSLGYIRNLQYYAKAYISTIVRKNRWNMLSAPLKQMYSLDYMVSGERSFLRYFNVEKEGSFYQVGQWSNPIPSVTIPLSVIGMGYSYLVGNNVSVNGDPVELYFPNPSVSDLKTDRSLNTDSVNRFLVETSLNTIGEVFTFSVSPSQGNEDNTGNPGGGFAIVGNPYMSHIDFDAFYSLNSGAILPQYKIFSNGTFRSYLTTNNGAVSVDSLNQYIPPMTSFFVTLRNSTSKQLQFVTDSISRTPSSSSALRTTSSAIELLQLSAKMKNTYESYALIGFSETSSNGYFPEEDAVKLFAADDIPEIFTQVGNYALDINLLSDKGTERIFVPMNIRTARIGEITVHIKGTTLLKNRDLYLLYSQTGTYEKISENDYSFTFVKQTTPDVIGEYYLLFENKENVSVDEIENEKKIQILSENNCVVIRSEKEPISDVRIYMIDGREIFSKMNISSIYLRKEMPDNIKVVIVKVVYGQKNYSQILLLGS